MPALQIEAYYATVLAVIYQAFEPDPFMVVFSAQWCDSFGQGQIELS